MSSNSCKSILTRKIKAEALRLGFSACGIAKAEVVDENISKHLHTWLTNGSHAGMEYMNNHFEKRINPQALVEGTRSIISVALNYYPQQMLPEEEYQIAWYAYGKDYHNVMRSKLEALFLYINKESTPVRGRFFCDTAPVLERYWAWKAGLGWIGKNTQLIIPQAGSTFFLGELFVDIELEYNTPLPNRCGTCSQCLKACPTQALESAYQLNSGKCLSYLTIENRGEIPNEYSSKMGNTIYGCDECQKACPWNKFCQPCQIPELQPAESFLAMTQTEWNQLSVEKYRELFKGSAIKRAKYEGLIRNIKAIHTE